MTNIKIPLDAVKDNFKSFLEVDENSRIFFSGKFGIGKTYFLKEFFEQNKTEYEVFHVYPVNYQIHRNDDVFELVKYDILVELLKKNKEIIQANDYNSFVNIQQLLYLWGKDNLKDIFMTGTSLVPKLGRPLKEVSGLIDNFYKFKKRLESGDKGVVEKFLQETKNKDVTETDNLSELLKRKITEQKNGKKSVLILDDMDRIDPEHVFRILNIFSAYFEQEHENKFGFDVVIVVADYTNIKNIFHHKYGAETDFSGYLDKFFTISPYYFDNKKAIIDMVDEIAKSIKNEEPNLSAAIGESGYIKLFLREIFIKTIDSEIINLRELLKATRFQLSELKKGGFCEDSFLDGFQRIFDIAIKISILIFSGPENFIQKLEVIKNYKVNTEKHMPHDKYITTMLKTFGIKIPTEDQNSVMWRGYKINEKTSGLSTINVDGGQEADLFYDLLIQYVKDEKYIKRNNFDYGR